MNLLLDTHALLWALTDEKQLSRRARTVITSPRNRVHISAASIWEISIKKTLGMLPASIDLEEILSRSGFEALEINIKHAMLAGELPKHHEDPFDRMLIAQAIVEKLTLVTRDAAFDAYGVQLLEC